jgi:hypothetical protein
LFQPFQSSAGADPERGGDGDAFAVENFEGSDGDGIPYALAQNDAAVWDGLYTDIAVGGLPNPYPIASAFQMTANMAVAIGVVLDPV